MRIAIVLLFFASLFVGVILSANIYRMGLEQSLDTYGTGFTIISGFGLFPLFLSLAFLFDKRQGPPSR